MRNYIYKLIFPESGKLYVGKAANEHRYPNNYPNQQFIGPHHNVEVQNLLDNGEFCYFHVVKVFETTEELNLAEETYLKKVWKTDDWATRPRWLLNRSRSASGFLTGNLHHWNNPDSLLKLSQSLRQQWEEGRRVKSPDCVGKPWETNDSRRSWDLEKTIQLVKQRLEETNYSYHWGRKQMSEELDIPEVTLKRIATKLRNLQKND